MAPISGHLASPDGVRPGNKIYLPATHPVLGALDEAGLTIGKAIYSLAVDTIYPVQFTARSRDGKDPREYLPVGQYQPDQ